MDEKIVSDETLMETPPQGVDLALGIGRSKATKGDAGYLTEMVSTFRGIDQMYMLPFSRKSSAIESTDRSLFHIASLSPISSTLYDAAITGTGYADGLVKNNGAHLYPSTEVFLPRYTASMLVYGRASTASGQDPATLHRYGTLTPHGLGTMDHLRTPAEIGFDPVPIYTGGIPDEGGIIAQILTDFVKDASKTTSYYYWVGNQMKESSVTLSWNNGLDDARLRDYYLWVTNSGIAFPGSGTNVAYMFSYLYRALKNYDYAYFGEDTTPLYHTEGGVDYVAYVDKDKQQPLTLASLYNDFRDYLIARIDGDARLVKGAANTVTFTSADLNTYPSSYGLPDGCAVLRWNGLRYEAVNEVLDGVAPMSSYCYPPDLWYYANTTLRTSDEIIVEEEYTSDKIEWDDILSQYDDGRVVYGSTESVALENPLQYSCGMLVATVRATAAVLDDGDGYPSTTVTLGSTSFPITGVIIGGQKSLGFDFSPVGNGEYYLYDDQFSGVYLTSGDHPTVFRSFVSATAPGREIYFCLEVRNATDKPFTGAEGIINPGAKFYLLGQFTLPENSTQRVFQQDHTTVAEFTVSSLAQAHCAIPDLEHPRLTLGIDAQLDWIQSTSSYIVMY